MTRLPADQMLRQGFEALQSNRLQLAEQSARAVLAVRPDSVEAMWLLGVTLDHQARFDEAEATFQAADRIRPNTPRIIAARARLEWRIGNFEKAIEHARRVRGNADVGQGARIVEGSSHRRLGRPKEALEVLRPVMHLVGGASEYAQACIDLNDPEQAIATLRPLEGIVASRTPAERYAFHHTLGEAQEDLGRYAEAFASYQRANDAYPPMFHEQGFRSGLPLLREVFTKERMHSAERPTARTERPVFIAAMPRSGTTLLDRIIAAHPQCGGAGETRALSAQVFSWRSNDPESAWPRNSRRFGTAEFDGIVRQYLKETDIFGATALRISDKHLQNWVWVGLISMAFPDARVIHIHRNLMDTGISCFERLEPPAIPWSTRLEWIGLALRGAAELMDYWKENAPIPILTVQYETLVREPESETRRIIEFLGLEWDDACLAHDRKRAGQHTPPPTLGTDQAAKPIHDRSIGRAERFGNLLDPLRDALARPI